MKLGLLQIVDILHAEGSFPTTAEATGYSTNSETISAGDLFFAVRGKRFDAHDYVEQALTNGAVAAVVSQHWLPPCNVEITKLVRLPDAHRDCVLHALQTVAQATRRLWAQAGNKRVIGITGSAGKTTTKDCTAKVLSVRFNVLKTSGNLNNKFGLPLQLLRLQPEHDVAVLEMGMSHAGEIATLAKIAEPDWGVITNVAAVHTEFFAHGIEGVALAKRELIDALPIEGLAFLNGDDHRVASFAQTRMTLMENNVLYGMAADLSIRAVDIEDLGFTGTNFVVEINKSTGNNTLPKRHSTHLALPGRHNIMNALAAISVGLASGIPLHECCESLESLQATEQRGNMIDFHGARLINDCYNANPYALNAMMTTFAATPARRRILVVGEMLELGPEGPAFHFECGRVATQLGLDIIIGVRGLAKHLTIAAHKAGTQTILFQSPENAGAWLRSHLQPGDLVLLKASRGVQLERALDVLAGRDLI